MPQNATYFISRLIKIGEITHNDIISALENPKIVTVRKSSFTITDFMEQRYQDQTYYSGRLTKFRSEGSVKVLKLETRKVIDIIEPDLIISSSQFLYLPEFGCFVYQRIWNQIDMATFAARMRDLILVSKDYFMVDCKLEPVSDIKNFLKKVKRFSSINQIKATVNPPNPLFGHLWKSLETYLRNRNLDELKLDEKSRNKPINSSLLTLLIAIDSNLDLKSIDPESIEIGDAAILMSIDGYGYARIEGKSGNRFITISTGQKSVQFHFPIGENLDDLYLEAKKLLDNVNNQRYMSHEE